MDKDKIIRQAFMYLGINRSDMDLNNNVYYRNAIEILSDMREQILEGFEFQVKIANLAKLPVENFPNLYKDGQCLLAYTLPDDFHSLRNTDEYSAYIQIKGNTIYMPSGITSVEYYSSNIPYEDFPRYAELYIVFQLCLRMTVFLGRDATQFLNNIEIEKLKIKEAERRNTGFSYNGNNLARW